MNQSINFEDVALNVDTNKTQNSELVVDAADFSKFLAMEDFKHYELPKSMGSKQDGFGPVMAKVSSPYLL